MNNKLVIGALAVFVVGFAVVATLLVATSCSQAERPLAERGYPLAPHVLSEIVQRIARDEQIWRRVQFATVESYVDFLALADQIAKRRFTQQMQQRGGEADIDEEYRATLAMMCVIPLPGKPPQYNDILGPLRKDLAATAFTSQEARQNALTWIKGATFEIRADVLKTEKDLSPKQFFHMR